MTRYANSPWLALAAWIGLAGALAGQTPRQIVPKLEPIAETRLLMEGLAHPNFKSLEKNLQQKPTEEQVWLFARGQALLLAETGNLLMLRPPKNAGEGAWMEKAIDLRTQATGLARALGNQEFEKARLGLFTVASTCNRCHQTFRIAVDIQPFKQPAPNLKVEGHSENFPEVAKAEDPSFE